MIKDNSIFKIKEDELYVESVNFNYSSEFFTYLKNLYEKNPNELVDISSFGMYLGFSSGRDWHKRYPVAARSFVELINRSNLRIVIGVPEILECLPNCPNCGNNYNIRLKNFQDTKEKMNLPMKFIKNSHLKMYKIGNFYFTGGINLTNSTYLDTSFQVKDPKLTEGLQKNFENLWKLGSETVAPFYASVKPIEEDREQFEDSNFY